MLIWWYVGGWLLCEVSYSTTCILVRGCHCVCSYDYSVNPPDKVFFRTGCICEITKREMGGSNVLGLTSSISSQSRQRPLIPQLEKAGQMCPTLAKNHPKCWTKIQNNHQQLQQKTLKSPKNHQQSDAFFGLTDQKSPKTTENLHNI